MPIWILHWALFEKQKEKRERSREEPLTTRINDPKNSASASRARVLSTRVHLDSWFRESSTTVIFSDDLTALFTVDRVYKIFLSEEKCDVF